MQVAAHICVGNPNVLRVGSIIEEQIFAQVLLLALAIKTNAAGRRMPPSRAARFKPAHIFPQTDDIPGQLMAKRAEGKSSAHDNPGEKP